MQTTHQWLTKKYKWYKKWHEKPYAVFFHIIILLAFFSYNMYLLLEIFRYAQEL